MGGVQQSNNNIPKMCFNGVSWDISDISRDVKTTKGALFRVDSWIELRVFKPQEVGTSPLYPLVN